ncbi:hypothetical protein Btru_043983 [Bulinus truncatus]|nr:hypothetical protein Btru_043983 [Bulinus truncatus]
MAEYLYLTQQFEAFYSALDRLVNQSKMSAEDAQSYAKSVALQYQKLQVEDYEDRMLAEKRMYPRYPVNLDQVPVVEIESQNGPSYAADDRYPPNEYFTYPSQAAVPSEERYIPQSADLGGDINLYDFLAALWNEAYGKGNEEAQEIVRLLYDRLSQDNNPDDIGQIRDILVETVAASLNDKPYNVRPNEIVAQASALKPQSPVVLLKETPKEKAKEAEALKKVEEKIVKEVKEEIKEAKAEKQAEAKAEQQKQRPSRPQEEYGKAHEKGHNSKKINSLGHIHKKKKNLLRESSLIFHPQTCAHIHSIKVSRKYILKKKKILFN